MKYYVIINGESSLDIQGLAIESLPAISKPLMRSKREEIDGRNGDIITQLGFSAYDKTLKIGLWGNYDIDEIISYFNQDGIITFSNEPDMYYNFTILNRIDFINQLEAFRKATITIHCQPFKYKEEETEELEIITKEVSGTDISVNDAVDGAMNITLKGNTSQVQLSGKNKLPLTNQSFSIGSLNYSVSNGILQATGNRSAEVQKTYSSFKNNFATTLPAGTYKVNFSESGTKTGTMNFFIMKYSDDSEIKRIQTTYDTFTLSEETQIYLGIYSYQLSITGTLEVKIMLCSDDGTSPSWEQYCGGTPSPNPSYPQDIHNVSGNNSIVVCGKNLYIPTITNNGSNISPTNCTATLSGDEYTFTATGSDMQFGQIAPANNNYANSLGTLYEVSNASSIGILLTNTSFTRNYITFYNSNKVSLGYTRIDSNTGSVNVPSGATYFSWRIGLLGATSGTTYKTKVMVSYNEIPTTYEAYNGITYPINLPSGMELCKIGTYQDYFYKENDKWYLHKEIGKVVLNGSETWQDAGTNRFNCTNKINDFLRSINNITYVCNNYQAFAQKNTNSDFNTLVANESFGFDFNSGGGTDIRIKDINYDEVSDYKTWLSTHNTIIYYVLATATDTEITDSTLISQLNAIKSANSYYGTTNINQVNNDMPFILDVSYLSGTNNITITNHGNYYSKPKLTLTGTGNIGIYLNDSQIFQVALGTDETIIIDTDKMEAYYESTLKNRQVIGDYNSFKLLSGENTIKISGTFSKLQVDNYSRWI